MMDVATILAGITLIGGVLVINQAAGLKALRPVRVPSQNSSKPPRSNPK